MTGPVDPRPVLVTGASGFVGGSLVRALAGRGRNVRAMLRRTSNAEAISGLPVEVVYADALDPIAVHAAVQGCSAVYHCIVDTRVSLSDATPMYRNNVESVVNVMDAALAFGVERFVYTSTIGTLGLNPGGPVTEDIPFNWTRVPKYIRARLDAETKVLEYCRTRGLPAMIMCVANTYGPGDYLPTPHNGTVGKLATGEMTAMINVGQPTVDIRDAVEALIMAEDRGTPGERYAIAADYVSARHFCELIAKRSGIPMPRLLPYALIHALARISTAMARLRGVRDHSFTPDAMFLAQVFKPIDSSKARRELGWKTRPFEQTVNDAVDWFMKRKAGSRS